MFYFILVHSLTVYVETVKTPRLSIFFFTIMPSVNEYNVHYYYTTNSVTKNTGKFGGVTFSVNQLIIL